MKGTCKYVVATMAFGIGLDKPDLDGVLHATMPASLEQFVQETGRCNRDGASVGCCHLVLRNEDYRQRYQQTAGSDVDRAAIRMFLHVLMRTAHCEDSQDDRVFESVTEAGFRRLAVFSRDEVIGGTNCRQEEEFEVLLNVMDLEMKRLFGGEKAEAAYELFFRPSRTVELRCYAEDLTVVAEKCPLVETLLPVIKSRQGVHTIDLARAMAFSGIDAREIEDELQSLFALANVTCVRKGGKESGCVVLRIGTEAKLPTDEQIDTAVGNIVQFMSCATQLQLRRLKSAYLAFSAPEVLRDSVENYFSNSEDSATEADECVARLLEPWKEVAMTESLNTEELQADAQGVMRRLSNRQGVVEATYRRVFDLTESSWYGNFYVSPMMLARILAGLGSYTYDHKSKIAQWGKQRLVRFD
eukprot:Polyplicarium_translucidae@DN3290_c0_g2_i2.p1